jgi:hypothetical protein
LHEIKIHITGTVIASRKDFPSEMKKKNVQKYELCAYQCDMIRMCLSFHEKEVSDNAKYILWPSNTVDYWL